MHSIHRKRRKALTLWLFCCSALLLILPRFALPTYGAGSLFTWETRAPSPIIRMESQGVMLNGKLYVFGGFYNTNLDATRRSDVYNVQNNSWVRIADMPEALTHAAHAVDGASIFLIGGYLDRDPGIAVNRVWIYNTLANTWSAGPDLPAARAGGGAAVVGRELHFFAGSSRQTRSTSDTIDTGEHWVLDLNAPTNWRNEPDLPLFRNHMGVVTLNAKIYVVGGQLASNEATKAQSRVDVYDPANNSWSRVADLLLARSHIGASVLAVNGRIIMLGGSVNGGSSGLSSSDVFTYDPVANLWLKMKSLPAGRKSPVAGYSNGRLVVATGNSSGPTSNTWSATLPHTWEQAGTMSKALGEVAGGIIGNRLYLVGEGSSTTLAYNLSTASWTSSGLATRPFTGNHHAAEVIDGKLYLFGGLGGGAGKVQIYDPAANSWSLGSDMPFAAGSSSSALINGKIYVAGGIVGSSTSAQGAVYNPANNSWQAIAPMPQGRNHAAAATDGSKLYIFGGRGAGSGDGNVVANGFDTLQIYNPANNTWQSSQNAGSNLDPLPIGRGGMGKAIFANNQFYVMGGETATGTGATSNKVYDRVDIYNPASNSWSQGATMPTARHGMFPLLIGGRVYVAGGGTKAGFSQSNLLEIYNLPFSTSSGSTPTPTFTASPTSTSQPSTSTSTSTASPTNTSQPSTSTPSATSTSQLTPSPAVMIRINAGGPALSNAGVNWLACTSRTDCSGYVTGGTTYLTSRTITLSPQSLPANLAIYQSARGADSSSSPNQVIFNIGIPNGLYRLRLHFAEFDKSASGQRVFSIQIENSIVASDYDIFAQAGGRDKAVVMELNTTVSDAELNLLLVGKTDAPRISGIELLSLSSPTATSTTTPSVTSSPTPLPTSSPTPLNTATSTPSSSPTTVQTSSPTTMPTSSPTPPNTATSTLSSSPTTVPTSSPTPLNTATSTPTSSPTVTPTLPANRPTIRINTGGPAVTLSGISWSADQFFSGGKAYSNTNVVAIAATDDDLLYLNERSAVTNSVPFSYNIPLENGSYEVRLHFAEIYWVGSGGGPADAGRRVFDVDIEGGPIELDNYDINADVGPKTAVIKAFTVAVSDGLLNIDFSFSIDQPSISAIEIIPVAQGSAGSELAAWPWAAQANPSLALRLGVSLDSLNPFFCAVAPPSTVLRSGFSAQVNGLPAS